MEQWEKNFYISAIAGANNGSSLVVMSKGRGSCAGRARGFDESILWECCDDVRSLTLRFSYLHSNG